LPAIFSRGSYRTAFLLSLLVSQVWRVLSEMLRADFPRLHRLPPIRRWAMAAIVYGGLLCLLLPQPAVPRPDIAAGLLLLIDPVLLLGLKALWFILFFISAAAWSPGPFCRSRSISTVSEVLLPRLIERNNLLQPEKNRSLIKGKTGAG
jgi:hypothetical protein